MAKLIIELIMFLLTIGTLFIIASYIKKRDLYNQRLEKARLELEEAKMELEILKLNKETNVVINKISNLDLEENDVKR